MVKYKYILDLIVANYYSKSREFKQSFYGYKNLGYNIILGQPQLEAKGANYYNQVKQRWAYAPLWDNAIEILTPSEF